MEGKADKGRRSEWCRGAKIGRRGKEIRRSSKEVGVGEISRGSK